MGHRKDCTNWLALAVLCALIGFSRTETISVENVMDEFICVPGMRMAEYNFWLTTDIADCARLCLEEKRIYCKSFSYSFAAVGCGIYENTRADVTQGVYCEGINPVPGQGDNASWNYYERKSTGYKALEEKMQRLENLTEISVEEATEVLTEFGDSLQVEQDPEGSGNDVTVSPGELDLMSQMLKLVVNLNPVSEASAKVSERFTNVLVNVSDSMMQPSLVQSWIALQLNPDADGIAGIVTSSEVVTRHVSERLLHYDNSTSIVAESGNIGMWLDIVELHDTSEDQSKTSNFANLMDTVSSIHTEVNFNQFLEEKSNGMYVFPPDHKARRKRDPTAGNQTDFNKVEDPVLGGDVIMLPSKALRNRSVVTHVRYKGLSDVMPSREINQKSPKNGTSFAVKSAVLTTSIHPRPAKNIFEKEPVVIIFTHHPELVDDSAGNEDTESPEDAENSSASSTEARTAPSTIETTVHCVFWKERDGTESGGWSEEGCRLVSTNDTHTICKCKHLTSFAVLMKMVDTSVQDESYLVHIRALSFISYIGCALSLGGVVIICGAFIMLKFNTENMKIHFNLGIAVGAADLVFMFEELAQRQQYSCVLVTVLLYYFNMAVLSWMLIEGLFLYSQVVVVFVSARRWVKYYVFAGWGIPAVVMGISMGILNVQLGSNKICWLSPADNSIWAFAAPAILVIFINFVILISVVRVIVSIQPDQTNNVKISKLKNAVRGSIFLSPLLGTTWLFGLLSLSGETLLFEYLFAITNSLQGFFLFVFHCLCNSEVRADFARRHSWKTTSSNGGKSPSWFSGLSGLNVASGLRKFRESISFDFASSSENSADQIGKDVKESPKIRRSKTSRSLSVTKKVEYLRRREKTDIYGRGDATAFQHKQNISENQETPSDLTNHVTRPTNDDDNNGDQPGDSTNQVTNQVTRPTNHDNNNGDQVQPQHDGVTQNADKTPTVVQGVRKPMEDYTVVKKKFTLPPLPVMPVKNDIILTGKSNRVSPMPPPASGYNQLPEIEQATDREYQENILEKESEPPVPPPPPHAALEVINEEELQENEMDKEGYKIAMSYDSGLNSIDNESLLEEEYYDEFVEMPYGKYRVNVNGCDLAL